MHARTNENFKNYNNNSKNPEWLSLGDDKNREKKNRYYMHVHIFIADSTTGANDQTDKNRCAVKEAV